jgi:cytochrome P450
LGLAPTLLAPQAVAARARIQAALKEYYEAGYDQGPDVSAFVKDRAAAKRQLGANPSDLASGEAEIPWGPLANTVPSLLWFFLNVFARPGYAERVRQETAQATTIDGDSATIDVGKLGKQPFIGACLQEVQRLYNKQCSYRQVLEDTVLRDGDGRKYLLKKGALVQWFHGVNHLNEDVWGPDVGAFDADRFLSAEPDQEKKQRVYMMPFGGGKHLCPGRRFAVTNIMCMVCALALVFDVEGVAVPPSKAGYRLCHMLVPAWETGRQPTARFRRRQGWEKMRVKFVA